MAIEHGLLHPKIADSWWVTFVLLGIGWAVVLLAAYYGWKEKRNRRG